MTQIILPDGIALPEASGDKYACWEETLTRQVKMISGRVVLEAIGKKHKIWRAKWAYDYLDNETTRRILPVLRSAVPLVVSVLPNDRDEMVTSSFVVDSLTEPSFLFFDNGEPAWHGLAFTLREERPHA